MVVAKCVGVSGIFKPVVSAATLKWSQIRLQLAIYLMDGLHPSTLISSLTFTKPVTYL
jgi:hypothetical protein